MYDEVTMPRNRQIIVQLVYQRYLAEAEVLILLRFIS